MARVRTRSTPHRIEHRLDHSHEHFDADGGLAASSGYSYYWPSVDTVLKEQTSEMTDHTSESFIALRKRKLSRKWIKLLMSDQVFPCDHTHVKYKYLDSGRPTVCSFPWSLPGPDGIQTHTRHWATGSLVRERLTVSGFPYSVDNLNMRTSSDPFYGPDWFSLMEEFREACNRLMPAKSILGESLLDNVAFMLPFRLLLNPSRFVKDFFKRVNRIGEARHSLLGQLVETAKESASTLLGFQFGISPAIDEIINVLSAQSRVHKRIEYLNKSADEWVPIRVRRVLPCEVVDNGFSSPPYPGSYTVECKTIEKTTTCVISALGKVRADIGDESVWDYYLQTFGLDKIVGLAWEAIPFSFVLDWFTNFQERINSLSTTVVDSPFVAFKRFTHSMKQHEKVRHFCMPNPSDSEYGMNTLDKPIKPWPVVETDHVRYQRFVSSPDTSGIIDLRNLGSFHAITSGALVIQLLP